MKLPEEIVDWKFGTSEQLCEAIVRDCAKAYKEWKKLNHFAVGDFPQYLKSRYGLKDSGHD